MSLNEIFADVKHEGDNDPFKDIPESDKETETPAESQPAKELEVVKPTEGGDTQEENLPFHKHPRWIERENELKELREFKEEVSPKLADLETFKTKVETSIDPKSNVPEWFQELYGNNPTAWEKYAEHSKTEREEIKKELVADQERQRAEAVQEEQKWGKWVEDGLASLEAKGYKFERNELIQTMLTYRPTDENNNFDFEAGYKILSATKPKEDDAKPLARKQLADTVTKSSKNSPVQKDYMTPSELRKTSWNKL